jgi:hypothetical protein
VAALEVVSKLVIDGKSGELVDVGVTVGVGIGVFVVVTFVVVAVVDDNVEAGVVELDSSRDAVTDGTDASVVEDGTAGDDNDVVSGFDNNCGVDCSVVIASGVEDIAALGDGIVTTTGISRIADSS